MSEEENVGLKANTVECWYKPRLAVTEGGKLKKNGMWI